MFRFDIIGEKAGLQADMSVVGYIFESVSNNVSKTQNGTVNIIFESDEVIKDLNRSYRSIDKTTDVLSFHYFDDYSETDEGMIAGEIILSLNKIRSQSEEYGISKEEEFYKLLIHSVLHLLGYDHEDDDDYKAMNKLESKIEKDVNERFGLKIR